MGKRKDLQQKKVSEILKLVKQHSALRNLAAAICEAKEKLMETESAYKLPREAAFEDTLSDMEEHYNSLADNTELEGISACGGDVDEWIAAQDEAAEIPDSGADMKPFLDEARASLKPRVKRQAG